MAKDSVLQTQFHGGISPDEKIGIPGSARFIKHLNVHEDANYATLFPIGTKVSGTTVANLVTWFADGSPFDTNRYAYDQAGKIYKITNAEAWSLLQTTSNASGNGFLVFDDYLYYALDAELGRYGRLTGTPGFDDAFLSDGTTDKDQSGGGTGSTDYVPPTTISEAATARQTFTPTRDPVKAIIINVDDVGSGDWTVTLHDKANNSIGTKAIVNGSMGTGDRTFTFATPLRVIIGNAYHFHVTSTVADGGVDTGTNTDLEDAKFSTLFGILISDVNWHPIVELLNGIVIGNEKYLAYWDQATYNPNRVQLASGFNVRSMDIWNEFVVVDCWQGTDIQDAEVGRRYYWDGIQDTFNFFETLPFGAPNVVHNKKNVLLSIGGQKGQIHLGTNPPKKIQAIPKLARGKKVEVFPGAVTEWQGKTYIGVGGSTDDGSSLEQGLYEFGSKNDAQSEVFDRDVLSFVASISTGKTQATTVKIGALGAFGKDLYMSWFDDSDANDYGVDKFTISNNPFASGSWESLVFDNGKPHKQKMANKLVIFFDALAASETVTPKYKIDRAASWVTGTTIDTDGATQARLDFGTNARFKEIEFGYNLVSSTTFLEVRAVLFLFDNLKEEEEFVPE